VDNAVRVNELASLNDLPDNFFGLFKFKHDDEQI
jgi:hypothetical protein